MKKWYTLIYPRLTGLQYTKEGACYHVTETLTSYHMISNNLIPYHGCPHLVAVTSMNDWNLMFDRCYGLCIYSTFCKVGNAS